MKYRKLLCLVLCIALCVPALAACTGSGPPPDDGGDDRYPFLAEVTGGYTLSGGQFKAVRYGNIPAALAGATVKPAGDVADSSVPTDASLLLCAAGAVDEEQIKRYVSISPSVDYTVEKLTDTEYSLTPVSNLEPGAVYSVDIGEEGKPAAVRFAFQTEAVFKLKSTLPADLAVGVPVNTGIELRFTEPVSGKDIAGHIKIEPAVEYEQRAYPDGKTVVLIPKDYLAENTVYTVSVSGELASAAGKTLGEDVTFKFRTEDESSVTAVDRVYIYPESQDLVFGTSQTPIFKWWVYTHEGQEIKESDALVKIWRYPSVHALADAVKMMAESRGDAYFSGEDFRYPTEGLEKVAEYTAPVTVLEQNLYNRKSFIELRTPGRGFYLCEVTLAASSSGESVKNTFQAIVQVTDMRLYTESQNSSMLLWLQGAGGLNVSAAKVTAELFKDSGNFYWNVQPAAAEYKTVEATADGDGICTIDTGDANYAYIIAEKGDDALFRYASIYDYKMARDYFATVFSDREVYFADDTINFRGFLRPARGGELPNRITVTTSVGAKFSLPVAPDGSFSGSYVLEDFVGWGIDFSFTDEAGNAVACKYVRVTQEEKPVYTATLSFDRPAYNFGEDMTLTLAATFFDGTPAPGLKFELSLSHFANGTVTLVTDDEGKATYTLKTGKISAHSTYPTGIYCSAQLTGYEGTTIYLNANALYFHSDVYLSYKNVTPDEGGGYILVTLNRFDPDKIAALKSTDRLYGENFPENLFAGPAEGSVTVTLAESWYEEIETGTKYDPISKKTSKTYRYEKRDRSIDTRTESFRNGEIRLDYVDAQTDRYVYYTVTYTDSRGSCSLTINARNGRDDWYIRMPDSKYYELGYDSSPKSVGDFTGFILTYGGEPITVGNTLFTVYTDRLDRYAITTGTYSLRFEASYIAGNQINVVYFDGSDFVYTGTASLSYDYEKNSSLELEIVPDKDSYKPGERATVTVRVVDKLTGKPVGSGAVTLAIVDEACFALGEQMYDPAAEFYRYVRAIPYICRNAAVSMVSGMLTGYPEEAWGGGGGGRETLAVTDEAEAPAKVADNAAAAGSAGVSDAVIREIFLNNPLFETIDASGDVTATFTFTVPDNITSWRLTAVAESETSAEIGGVKLGAATSKTIATLPFFVSAYANSRYIFGDEVTVSARVFGTALEGGASTEYIATLTDADGNIIKTLESSAPAGKQVFFSLGKLGLGSYSITVAAASGEHTDGVKLPFEVIESGVLVPVYRTVAPGEIGSLKPAAYPVTLTFYGAAHEQWLDAANRVMRSRSLRADTLAAYYTAGKAVAALFGGGEYLDAQLEEAKDRLVAYGGALVTLLPYDSEDIELSALILAAAPDALSGTRRSSIADTLRARLEAGISDEVEFAAIYLGLAAAGEPVLAELRHIAENCAHMPLRAQLYVAAALASIGDYARAAELYAQVREKYAGTGEDGTLWFAYPDAVTEERIAGAAAALLAASHIARDDADALARYIMTRTSTLELYVLQLAAYVRAFIPADGGELSLVYMTADGERHTEKVGPYSWVSLTLDKQALAGFRVVSADEGIAVRACYMGSPAEAMEGEKPTEQASLKKTVTVHDEARRLYKVTLDYKVTTDRDSVYFSLTDLIPSGGRYVYTEQSSYKKDSYAYLYCDGQTMRGGIFAGADRSGDPLAGRRTRTITGSVSYIFRAAMPGEYIAEAAFMQNTASGCYAVSARSSITLK